MLYRKARRKSCLHPHSLIQSPTQTTEITGQPSLLSADFKKFGPGYCKKGRNQLFNLVFGKMKWSIHRFIAFHYTSTHSLKEPIKVS